MSGKIVVFQVQEQGLQIAIIEKFRRKKTESFSFSILFKGFENCLSVERRDLDESSWMNVLETLFLHGLRKDKDATPTSELTLNFLDAKVA